MKITLIPDKITKNCVRFQEIIDNELDIFAVERLYINKALLQQEKWNKGKITISLDFEEG